MKELGFFIDNLGNIIYFGEWKEQYDKNNRHEIHCFSFIDEVEANEIFKKLNLQYNPEMGLYGKAITFALQGMITMQNLTSKGKSAFIMHSPSQLTEEQKKRLATLYPLLSSFATATIVVPKSIYLSEDDKINDVDSYYDHFEITKSLNEEETFIKKSMPDLFIAMSDEEMDEALQCAKDQDATTGTCYCPVNNTIKINGNEILNIDNINIHEDMNFYNTSGYWFPRFVEYIEFPTKNNDCVGILITPTIWPKSSRGGLEATAFSKLGLSCSTTYDPLFIRPREMMEWITSEEKYVEENPVNSPWTARDIEVVEAALDSIDEINSATIIKNANFQIHIWLHKYEQDYDSLKVCKDISKKETITEYNYPNIIQLDTNNGIFNVFMGKDIDLESVASIVEKKDIFLSVKEYEEEDNTSILFPPREKGKRF